MSIVKSTNYLQGNLLGCQPQGCVKKWAGGGGGGQMQRSAGYTLQRRLHKADGFGIYPRRLAGHKAATGSEYD